MSNLFPTCIVTYFPNLKVLKVFISDHITYLLRLLQWLLMVFMMKVTFPGLSQTYKAFQDLFPAFLIGISCCLCPYTFLILLGLL